MIALRRRHGLIAGASVALTACAAPSDAMPAPSANELAEAAQQGDATPQAAPQPKPAAEPVAAPSFTYDGELTQGGWIKGEVPEGTVSASLDGVALEIADDGSFLGAFDRDAGDTALLVAQLEDGRSHEERLVIAPRAWKIEHVNVARGTGRSSEAWWKKREPEWLAIKAARAKETNATGWRQDFIWPVKGRISGRFGSQRIYRGEPGSYHSGLDIAPGAGTPFVAPADGVVVLAATGFSLEGNVLIIDHGGGLNSAFLHAQSLNVKEGDAVTQGQMIGRVGSTGRSTGPHLHWGIKWNDARLDPLLFLPDAQ